MNQRNLIDGKIRNSENYQHYDEKLKIKVMTFDSCQGEERDLIIYSLVATNERDALNRIFGRDFEGRIGDYNTNHTTRLNVGFSRAKEKIHFVMSKPLEGYNGSIRKVLNHYNNVLRLADKDSSNQKTDKKSKMEKRY